MDVETAINCIEFLETNLVLVVGSDYGEILLIDYYSLNNFALLNPFQSRVMDIKEIWTENKHFSNVQKLKRIKIDIHVLIEDGIYELNILESK